MLDCAGRRHHCVGSTDCAPRRRRHPLHCLPHPWRGCIVARMLCAGASLGCLPSSNARCLVCAATGSPQLRQRPVQTACCATAPSPWLQCCLCRYHRAMFNGGTGVGPPAPAPPTPPTARAPAASIKLRPRPSTCATDHTSRWHGVKSSGMAPPVAITRGAESRTQQSLQGVRGACPLDTRAPTVEENPKLPNPVRRVPIKRATSRPGAVTAETAKKDRI